MELLVTQSQQASLADQDLVDTTSMKGSDEIAQPHEIMEEKLAQLDPSETLLSCLVRGVNHLTGMLLRTSQIKNGWNFGQPVRMQLIWEFEFAMEE